jgi:hypothetical protein
MGMHCYGIMLRMLRAQKPPTEEQTEALDETFSDEGAKYAEVWRPRRDLNPCCRRERPMSWARLDDGDANGEPCWIRTSDPLLKRQMLYRLS